MFHTETPNLRVIYKIHWGNSKTVMIANIGPDDQNFDETLETLRVASRAKMIKNKPKINKDPKDSMLRKLQAENIKLKEGIVNGDAGPMEIENKCGTLQSLLLKKIDNVENKVKIEEVKEEEKIFAKKKEALKIEIGFD